MIAAQAATAQRVASCFWLSRLQMAQLLASRRNPVPTCQHMRRDLPTLEG